MKTNEVKDFTICSGSNEVIDLINKARPVVVWNANEKKRSVMEKWIPF